MDRLPPLQRSARCNRGDTLSYHVKLQHGFENMSQSYKLILHQALVSLFFGLADDNSGF